MGGVVGLILLATALALLFFCLRKRRKPTPAYAGAGGAAGAPSAYASRPPPSNYNAGSSPMNTSASTPFGNAAANYEEAPAPPITHSVVPDAAPAAAGAGMAGMAGTGAGAAAARRSAAPPRRVASTRSGMERSASNTNMAAAADEVVGVGSSSPGRGGYSAYDSPVSSRHRGSQDVPQQGLYQHGDPTVWPSSYMDGWIAGENPYAAAGVGHGYADDPPPPTAFHMRPGQTLPGGTNLSPVGAFTQQPYSGSSGSTGAAQRSSRATQDFSSRSMR